MKRLLMVLLAVSLGGCFQQREARLEYQGSVERYKACVVSRGVAGCENERAIMEADERKYGNISAAQNDGAISATVSTNRR